MPSRHEAMAQRFTAAFNAADAAAMIAMSTPDVVIVPLRAALEDIVYHGPEGIEQWVTDILESWSELDLEPTDFTDYPGDRMLMTGNFRARGRTTDAPTQVQVFFVSRLRDGLVCSVRTFVDRDEALRAAAAEG